MSKKSKLKNNSQSVLNAVRLDHFTMRYCSTCLTSFWPDVKRLSLISFLGFRLLCRIVQDENKDDDDDNYDVDDMMAAPGCEFSKK